MDVLNKLGAAKLQQNGKLENFLTNGSVKISPDVLKSVFDNTNAANTSSVSKSVFASNMAAVEEQGITESSYADGSNNKTMSLNEDIEDMFSNLLNELPKMIEDAVANALSENGNNSDSEKDENEPVDSKNINALRRVKSDTGLSNIAKPNDKKSIPVGYDPKAAQKLDVDSLIGIHSADDIKDKTGSELYDMYKNFLKDTYDPFDSDSSYGTKANAALVKILKYANEDQMKEFAKKMKESNDTYQMFYLKRALNNVTVSNDELDTVIKKIIAWEVKDFGILTSDGYVKQY